MRVPVALRNLGRNPRRTRIALAAIACGVAAFVVSGGFIEWILVNFREETIHSLLGHIQIVRPAPMHAGNPAIADRLLADDVGIEKAIREVPGVLDVAPRLEFQGLLSNGDASISFAGTGIVPSRERELSRNLAIVSGRNLTDADRNAVVLGEGVGLGLGAGPGAQLVLLANTARGGINASDVEVRGVFSSVTKSFDDTAIRVPIALARQILRVQGSHSWTVVLRDTEDTDRVVAALRERLSTDRYAIKPWYTMADFYNKTVTFYHQQLNVVRCIIALIILMSISNTMAMSVVERTSEIGTALALGTPRRAILRGFLAEAFALGALGGLLGVVLGATIAWVATAVGIPMPPSPGIRHGFTAGIEVTGSLMVEGVVLAFVPAVVATLYPAWRATRVAIVDALRYSH